MRVSLTKALGLLTALVATATTIVAAPVDPMSERAKAMSAESMEWMDRYYDADAGYLYHFSGSTALRHDTRSTIWYAFGLYARNQGDDFEKAEKIVHNVIGAQFKDPESEWFGDYQKEPEEPAVGTPQYPATRYNSWDPNWRGFVGTTLIMIMEEYHHLLRYATIDLILESLNNATIGDSKRYGGLGPGDDNLWPSYSNPAIMRAFVTSWTGHRLSNDQFVKDGELYAQDIIDLFNNFNTLSEFNSGTYTGVSLFGLILWTKYLPENSVMTHNAPRMIELTWEAVAEFWHPNLRNIAGPWDRTYGYDMNRYLSLMALWFWPLIGKEKAGLNEHPEIMSHNADFSWAPLFAALFDSHKALIPKHVIDNLGTFQGEKTYQTTAWYPPIDKKPRNFTVWMNPAISIGAESYDAISAGGPARSTDSYNPAVIQWYTEKEVSFMSLYPSERAMNVMVQPGRITMEYPYGNAKSKFEIIVGTFKDIATISTWNDIPNLRIQCAGNVDPAYEVAFGGQFGGSKGAIHDFENWRFTYFMPPNFQGVPRLILDVAIPDKSYSFWGNTDNKPLSSGKSKWTKTGYDSPTWFESLNHDT